MLDKKTIAAVLILVLVEHTLGDHVGNAPHLLFYCLNPCFSGTYSRSYIWEILRRQTPRVLILVLVEHTLGAFVIVGVYTHLMS